MNKLITIIFSIVVFCFIFTSCDNEKNEDTRQTYPCIYLKDKVVYQPVVLYTNKDVIYDYTKINAFRKRLRADLYKNADNDDGIKIFVSGYFGDFVFDDMTEYCNNEIIAKQVSKDSIEMLDIDFIFSGSLNRWGSIEYEEGILSAVKEKNGITYWESKDTTEISSLFYDPNNSGYAIMLSHSISKLILCSEFDSLTPLYCEKTQSPNIIMGLNFYPKHKSCIYLCENKDNIYVPYMEILYEKQGKTATYKLNNIPLSDAQIMSKIAEGDTLVLQQSRLYLSKYSKTN